MTTDADIDRFLNRKTLHERAKEEAARAKQAEADAKLETWGRLLDELRYWMREALGMTPGEIAGINFERRTRTDQRMGAYFEIEGIRFSAYFKQEKVMDKKSSEFADEPIHEDVLVVTMCINGGFDYREVTTLADIGQRL